MARAQLYLLSTLVTGSQISYPWVFHSQVGLAVGDIESVQKSAFLRNQEKVIKFVVRIERNFPKWITRRFYRPEMVVIGRKVARKITSQ